MKKNSIKYIVVSLVLIIIGLLVFFIYKNVFGDVQNTRYKGIENYKLSNDEKNSVKNIINELEGVKDVDVYIDSKIIKIVVKIDEDIEFESLKEKANEVISSFKEDNLSFYDLEFFIDSSSKDSEIYPQIGYKFKTNSEFLW